LEDSYLSEFLDSSLPLLPKLNCRDLQKAWCVLRDCAGVLQTKTNRRSFLIDGSIDARALLIRREELVRAIHFCANVEAESANEAINFFTSDLQNLTTLFTKGLWSMPLVPIDEGEYVAMCAPAIFIGSTLRRIESWLDRGGLSDHLSDAKRGIKYEAWVRKIIFEELAENSFLSNAKSLPDSVDFDGISQEQVDLVILLGNLLLVGEVKCRLYPVESLEKYNYLQRLDDAGKQAVRKAGWLKDNSKLTADLFGISLERAKSLKLVPLVVVNQGAGFGLQMGGARIVDFHFLRLYLSDNKYLSGMAVDFDGHLSIPTYQKLYDDENDAAHLFEETMASPPPVVNALGSVNWRDNRLPINTGQTMLIANCYAGELSNEPGKVAATLLSMRKQAPRRARK
jgi:hypothetical protein